MEFELITITYPSLSEYFQSNIKFLPNFLALKLVGQLQTFVTSSLVWPRSVFFSSAWHCREKLVFSPNFPLKLTQICCKKLTRRTNCIILIHKTVQTSTNFGIIGNLKWFDVEGLFWNDASVARTFLLKIPSVEPKNYENYEQLRGKKNHFSLLILSFFLQHRRRHNRYSNEYDESLQLYTKSEEHLTSNWQVR